MVVHSNDQKWSNSRIERWTPATVFIRVDDLVPEFRAELENAKIGSEWDQEAVASIVTKEYGFLGHFVSCRIEPDQRPGSDSRDLLVVEFNPPEDRDVQMAHEQFQQAVALAGGGDLDTAARLLSQVTRRFPEIPEFRRALGQALLELGDSEGAMQELQTVLCLDPRDSDALVLVGNIHMARREPEKARTFYARVIKLAPTAYALTNLAGALGELGDLDGAVAAFEEALDQDPSYEQARLGLELVRVRKAGQAGD